MRYFYEEQLHRMECLSQEPVLFEDILCQLSDMVKPAQEGVFTLTVRPHPWTRGPRGDSDGCARDASDPPAPVDPGSPGRADADGRARQAFDPPAPVDPGPRRG